MLRLADWTSGYAWYEACGGLSTYTLEDFDQLTEAQLNEELLKLKIN